MKMEVSFFKREILKGGIISRSSKVDLVFLYFIFHFYFIFNLFLFFLFLELRVRVSDNITRSHINHSVT